MGCEEEVEKGATFMMILRCAVTSSLDDTQTDIQSNLDHHQRGHNFAHREATEDGAPHALQKLFSSVMNPSFNNEISVLQW